MRKDASISAVVLGWLIYAAPAWGLDCVAPAEAGSFKYTVLTRASDSLDEPVRMDLDGSSGIVSDIYFIERKGRVRRIRAPYLKTETLGWINTKTLGEQGLSGIALDPGFGTNRRIWISYLAPDKPEFRVSRFRLQGDVLDIAGEKVILRVPITGAYQQSGTLLFDAVGNLFISVGCGGVNGQVSADSRDFRGKILRIRPNDTGYAIPAGNLFPPDRYPDSPESKTRPEIYAMGVKQSYSLGLDPASGRILAGEMGPDNGGLADELNLLAGPGNYGWPFFYCSNLRTDAAGPGMDPEHPVNSSPNNTGLTDLPRATPATISLRQNAPITGPVFRYAISWPGPERLHSSLDGLWFSTDFGLGFVDTARVGANGSVGALGRVASLKLEKPVEMRAGPDGALYVVNYGGWLSTTAKTSIARIGWEGPCGTGTRTANAADATVRRGWDGWGTAVPKGPHEVEYRDVTGRLRWGRAGR